MQPGKYQIEVKDIIVSMFVTLLLLPQLQQLDFRIENSALLCLYDLFPL
jgi:hypothetical protein